MYDEFHFDKKFQVKVNRAGQLVVLLPFVFLIFICVLACVENSRFICKVCFLLQAKNPEV